MFAASKQASEKFSGIPPFSDNFSQGDGLATSIEAPGGSRPLPKESLAPHHGQEVIKNQ
jgi:hypothetical protein